MRFYSSYWPNQGWPIRRLPRFARLRSPVSRTGVAVWGTTGRPRLQTNAGKCASWKARTFPSPRGQRESRLMSRMRPRPGPGQDTPYGAAGRTKTVERVKDILTLGFHGRGVSVERRLSDLVPLSSLFSSIKVIGL